MKFSPKQIRFVCEYFADRNPTLAAIRAGYSAQTAPSIGTELLTRPEILKLIRAIEEDLKQEQERQIEAMLLAAYFSSIRAGQYATAVRACELLDRQRSELIKETEASAQTANPRDLRPEAVIGRHVEAVYQALRDRGLIGLQERH